MKIVVTGANGFLGYRLCNFLKAEHEVVGLVHDSFEITDIDSVVSIFQRIRPEIVIHCAGISDRITCETKTDFAYNVNVNGTLNIARACKIIGAKMIFCSSDQVYDNSGVSGAHSEDETLNPSKVYALFKLESEQGALSINENTVCLRLTAMYDATYDINREHYNLLAYVMRDLKGQNPMTYSGDEHRGFTDVTYVIKNIPKVFTLPGGAYNFGSENNESTYSLMSRILQATDYDMTKLKKSETECSNICMNMEKAASYGIYFPNSIEGLRRALQRAIEKENSSEKNN